MSKWCGINKMKTSIKIGEILDIPIRLHFTLLIIIGFIAWSIGGNVFEIAGLLGIDPSTISPGFQSYLIGFFAAVGLFASVFFHELAHSVTAMRMGVEIEEISLWIFGGISNMEEIPHEPNLEIKMSAVGPLTSIGIGAICSLIGMVTPPILSFIFLYLGFINFLLAGFNLIPAFPMDGGRILRALFVKRESYVSATNKAASVGKGFAIVLGILGIFIFSNVFFILIAFFIYIGASQEAKTTMVKEVLRDVNAKDIMSKNVITVSPDVTIQEFIDDAFVLQHTGFPVVENGEVLGIITLDDVKELDRDKLKDIKVKDVMEKDLIHFSPNDDVKKLWQKMVENDIGRFPILSEGDLVGIVTRTDIMRSYESLSEIEKYREKES